MQLRCNDGSFRGLLRNSGAQVLEYRKTGERVWWLHLTGVVIVVKYSHSSLESMQNNKNETMIINNNKKY